MFLTHLKTALVKAMRTTLDADYIDPNMRGMQVSIEFPMTEQDYPSIWVDVEIGGADSAVQIAGIDHREYEGDASAGRVFTRWRCGGTVTYTAVALSSLERDRMFDEMVRIFAFGREAQATSEFRSYIESNPLLAINIDFDQVSVRALANASGTPWQTDEMIYEATVGLEFIAEFVSDSQTETLVPLTEIDPVPYDDQSPDPTDLEDWQ